MGLVQALSLLASATTVPAIVHFASTIPSSDSEIRNRNLSRLTVETTSDLFRVSVEVWFQIASCLDVTHPTCAC